SIEDDPCAGRPSTVTVDNTNASIALQRCSTKIRRITVREIEAETGISKTSVHRILTQVLGKQNVAARWVPHFLSAEQKATRTKRT
ncbi:hypothetical protein EAI_07446, partial [Harpegnathos saltator]